MSGFLLGFVIWFVVRVVIPGIYTVDQNERAVIVSFGRAQRLGEMTTAADPSFRLLDADESSRYVYPQLQVIQPGGPYFKWPWQRVVKASIATQTVGIAFDPENANANHRGTALDAVTKDQLNISLKGQLRFTVSERNLYAYLFGIKNPVAHILGYFISILREKIANFEMPNEKQSDPAFAHDAQGISVNDLRKNLSEINRLMETESRVSVPRYGVALDAVLITEITPPDEVESALAAINTAYNQVSSEISLARASADQKIVQSKRAVEIETLKAQAETQMLEQLAEQLKILKRSGGDVLRLYVRNVKLPLFNQISRVVMNRQGGQV